MSFDIHGDVYVFMAHRFNEKTGINEASDIGAKSHRQRFAVLNEEVKEVDEAVGLMILREDNEEILYDSDPQDVRADIAEELADVVVSAFSMAEAVDIDLREAYIQKMQYNLNKTDGEMVDGKVQDDVEVEKPDFTSCVGDGNE
jgi:NTP pyrophosphatase (non-canonical NTP hydrolase)